MKVLSLCQRLCPEKIPVIPGEYLGDGADGESFLVQGQDDKVIKFSVIYDTPFRPISTYQEIQKVLDYVMHSQSKACSIIYEHGYLGKYTRPYMLDDQVCAQPFVLYYYVMEKLQKLSEDEKKVFHSILSHEDRGIKKDLSYKKLNEVLQGLARGLDFDAQMIMLFCEHLRTASFLHLDLHPRNIMKDRFGGFKLIDLDRCTLQMENNYGTK